MCRSWDGRPRLTGRGGEFAADAARASGDGTHQSWRTLTDQRVVGPSVLAGAGPGQVAVALSPDPLTSSGVIRPGDRVNLVGQTETGPAPSCRTRPCSL